MNSRRLREPPRAMLPQKIRVDLRPLQLTTDSQGRPMISRDILDRAVFQSGILPSASPATPRQPVTQPQQRHRSPRRPVVRAKILKPPPEKVEERSTPDPPPQRRFWQGHDASNDYDSDDQPGPSPTNNFASGGVIAYGRNNFSRNSSGNRSVVSTRTGNELRNNNNNNNNNNTRVVSRANIHHNQGADNRSHSVALKTNSGHRLNNNNNNNNNNGVSNAGNTNTNANSNNSSLGAHLGGVRHMQNPIFLTVVHPDLNNVLTKPVTLKRSQEQVEPEPEEPPIQPKKPRLEFNTAQCFLCPCCDFITLSEGALMDHVEAAHPEKCTEITDSWEFDVDGLVECGDCEHVKFASKKELEEHMLKSHGTNRFTMQAIPKPPQQRESMAVMEQHEEFFISDSEVEVDEDDFGRSPGGVSSFSHNDDSPSPDYDVLDMNPASSSHTADSGLDNASDVPSVEDLESYNCAFLGCDVVLSGESTMGYHKKCHQNAGFTCPECVYETDSWLPMALHLWRSHRIDMNLRRCEHCDYRHTTNNGLNAHLAKHGLKTVCEKCKQKFNKGRRYERHVRTCQGAGGSPSSQENTPPSRRKSPKEVQCTECPRTFKGKKLMEKHYESVHQKAFPCDTCEFEGSDAAALDLHKRTHTGEIPLECRECNFRTADPNSLRRHMRRHSKTPVFSCPLCSFGCIQADQLKNHATAVHPDQRDEIVLACPFCKKEFIIQESLSRHIARCHSNGSMGDHGYSEESMTVDHSQESLVFEPTDASSTHGNDGSVNNVVPIGSQSVVICEGFTLSVPDLPALPVTNNAMATCPSDSQAMMFQSSVAMPGDLNFDTYDFFSGSEANDLFNQLFDSNANTTKPADGSPNMLPFL